MTAQTLTLTDFLLARVAEDEAAAKECARLFPPPWEIADRGWRVRIYSANVPLSTDVGEPGDERTPCVIEVEPTYAHDGWLSDNVAHIARHDPARVLAECEAKRRIVAEHPTYRGPRIIEVNSSGTDFGCELCHCIDPIRGDGLIEGLGYCTTLRALALPYADHPAFRAEWAL